MVIVTASIILCEALCFRCVYYKCIQVFANIGNFQAAGTILTIIANDVYLVCRLLSATHSGTLILVEKTIRGQKVKNTTL